MTLMVMYLLPRRFGIVATTLQLVPGASMVFGCTSIVGAALWAAELERAGEKANEPATKDVFSDK
jgi:hypothetical protein